MSAALRFLLGPMVGKFVLTKSPHQELRGGRPLMRTRCWSHSPDRLGSLAARDYERRLLSAFAEQHDGRRRFANLIG